MSGGKAGLKVTPEVEAAIQEFARTITTASAITEAVNAKLGTTLARRTVALVLERTRNERADISKNVLREALSKTVLSDLEMSEQVRDRLFRLADRCGAEAERGDPEAGAEYRKTVTVLLAVLKERMHWAGADVPDAPSDELKSAAERVQSRLARLTASGGAGQVAEGNRPDQGGAGSA